MSKGRLEAFSDGVIAVIITIMVLEMKSPHGTDLAALRTLVPTFLSYVLSFVYVGITGTTIIIFCMRRSMLQEGFCGRICIYCSGCL
jgi:uncharacterized membrane protein